MDCKTIKGNIVFIADGSLSSNEMQLANMHLNACPACSKLLHQVKYALTMNTEEHKMPRAETFFDDLMNKATSERFRNQEKSFVRRNFSIIQPLLAAASIAVVIFLGIHLMNSSKENLKQESTGDIKSSDINALASQYQMKDNGTDEVDTYYLNK